MSNSLKTVVNHGCQSQNVSRGENIDDNIFDSSEEVDAIDDSRKKTKLDPSQYKMIKYLIMN